MTIRGKQETFRHHKAIFYWYDKFLIRKAALGQDAFGSGTMIIILCLNRVRHIMKNLTYLHNTPCPQQKEPKVWLDSCGMKTCVRVLDREISGRKCQSPAFDHHEA